MTLPISWTLILAGVLQLLVWSAPIANGTEGELTASHPDPIQAVVDRDDSIWMINTRHLCYPCWDDSTTIDFHVCRYDRLTCQWEQSTLDEFLKTDAALPVSVYVHGNRVESNEVTERGWMAYHGLTQGSASLPRFRFVMWSWPSDQLLRPVRDVRSKAIRSDTESFFFGYFLRLLPHETAVSAIGYSLGARVISGGMHLLGGGSISGESLPAVANPTRPNSMRAVFLAAAMNNMWLCPGGAHERTAEVAEQLQIVFNTCDPSLKYYRFIDRCVRPEALGYTGLTDCQFPTVSQTDVRGIIGKSHDERLYFVADEIMASARETLFNHLSAP